MYSSSTLPKGYLPQMIATALLGMLDASLRISGNDPLDANDDPEASNVMNARDALGTWLSCDAIRAPSKYPDIETLSLFDIAGIEPHMREVLRTQIERLDSTRYKYLLLLAFSVAETSLKDVSVDKAMMLFTQEKGWMETERITNLSKDCVAQQVIDQLDRYLYHQGLSGPWILSIVKNTVAIQTSQDNAYCVEMELTPAMLAEAGIELVKPGRRPPELRLKS